MAHVLNLEINLEKLSANSPNYVSLCAAEWGGGNMLVIHTSLPAKINK